MNTQFLNSIFIANKKKQVKIKNVERFRSSALSHNNSKWYNITTITKILFPRTNRCIINFKSNFYFFSSKKTVFYLAREPWDPSSVLYLPKDGLILIENGAGAESIAALLLLDMLNLSFELKFAKNVNEMSPSGKKSF